MGGSNPVIVKVSTPGYKKVTIEASNGMRYESDLSALSGVFCFPKTESEWARVSIDSYGVALIWPGRFEAHVDQIIGLAFKSEKIPQSA